MEEKQPKQAKHPIPEHIRKHLKHVVGFKDQQIRIMSRNDEILPQGVSRSTVVRALRGDALTRNTHKGIAILLSKYANQSSPPNPALVLDSALVEIDRLFGKLPPAPEPESDSEFDFLFPSETRADRLRKLVDALVEIANELD